MKKISLVLLAFLAGCTCSTPDVLVFDFGSPSTPKIEERLDEMNVSSLTLPALNKEQIEQLAPKAIILSGSPDFVTQANHREPDPAIYHMGIPILGICYGMQVMADQLGGKVQKCPRAEVAVKNVDVTGVCDILPPHMKEMLVWYNHEECVTEMPQGFTAVGYSSNSTLAIACNHEKRLYATQFHPERTDKTPGGRIILEGFVNKFVR